MHVLWLAISPDHALPISPADCGWALSGWVAGQLATGLLPPSPHLVPLLDDVKLHMNVVANIAPLMSQPSPWLVFLSFVWPQPSSQGCCGLFMCPHHPVQGTWLTCKIHW